MKKNIQAVRGMNDILPEEAKFWIFLDGAVAGLFADYGYGNMRLPLVEATALFSRSIGEATDIVEKEMYTFPDRNGESLTLRPEATAGIVRATLQHNLTYERPQRVWTSGPMFRHERPQKGRYRQFHQVDVEALGFAGPDVDAEQIVMLARLWKALGLSDVELHINSIGDAEARARHRVDLVKYFEAHLDQLDEDARRRLHSNPLRTLDSKNPRLQHLVEAAPKLADYLDDAAREHFTVLQALLDAAGMGFVVDPRLVRGFDYYNRTVFEWITTRLGSQGTIAGGGRYDGLIEQLGGKAAPACGFAIGVERIVLLMKEYQFVAPARSADAYIVYVGDVTAAQALRLAESLRGAGLITLMHAGGGNIKTQMKKADASGARFAIIIGPEELAAGEVSLKPLRATDGQVRVAPARVAGIIQQRA